MIDTPVAIPPTVSLNDHAESMHAAQRKKRRIISAENIVPDFNYQQSSDDGVNLRKQMMRAFGNKITYGQKQVHPDAQNDEIDDCDTKVIMNRKLFKINTTFKLSYIFGSDFGDIIENLCGGVGNNNEKNPRNCVMCGNASSEWEDEKWKGIPDLQSLKAENIDTFKENLNITHENII